MAAAVRGEVQTIGRLGRDLEALSGWLLRDVQRVELASAFQKESLNTF